jgi:hypothetical protein
VQTGFTHPTVGVGAIEICVAQRYSGHGSPGLQTGLTHLAVVVGRMGIVGPHRNSGHGLPGVHTGFMHLSLKVEGGGGVVLAPSSNVTVLMGSITRAAVRIEVSVRAERLLVKFLENLMKHEY